MPKSRCVAMQDRGKPRLRFIERVHMAMGLATINWATATSAIGRYCCKSRKSDDAKNLAKVDFWTSLLLCSAAQLRRSVVDFGRRFGPSRLPHTKRISRAGNFRSSAQKEFFNTIGLGGNASGSGE